MIRSCARGRSTSGRRWESFWRLLAIVSRLTPWERSRETERSVTRSWKSYRPSTLVDLYDMARLVDRLEHIHRFCQTVVATEIEDPYVHNMNIAYACLAGTRKSFSVMLGAVQRTIRGIEVTDETRSYDVIEQAVRGPGHCLGGEQTLALMESEYLYLEVSDRTSPGQWQEEGSTDIRERAEVRVQEILSAHYPVYIDPKVDEMIRERFPIVLPRDQMRADSDRW